MKDASEIKAGDIVELREEEGAVVPAGRHTVSRVREDGSFHVGGNTAVWPRRVVSINGDRVRDGL